MRTTIDIPDELWRAAKARANQEGRTLKAIVIEGLQQVVQQPVPEQRALRRVKFPIIEGDPTAPPITDEMVNTALEQMYQAEDES